MTPAAGAITDAPNPADLAPPAGVRLDDGEIVILSLRQHWSAPALAGLGPTLLLAAALALLSAGRAASMPPRVAAMLWALALVPLLVALFRHLTRRYVLTDRRVMVRDGFSSRWVSLDGVRAVECRAPENRPGDIRYRTEAGVMLWTRIPRAAEHARVASEAVERYGRGS